MPKVPVAQLPVDGITVVPPPLLPEAEIKLPKEDDPPDELL